MATNTEFYAMIKPSLADVADIAAINQNTDKIDQIMHGSQTSIADAYDPAETYNLRDKVMHDFQLYSCLSNGTTGTWDPTKWERINAADTGGNYVDVTEQFFAGVNLANIDIDGDQHTIYAPVMEGATSQDDGEPGMVPAPTSQDVGKYLKSDGTWDNPPGGGGGGTTVIPNPQGTPTDTLNTIQIGQTVFDIPGSGGGAGDSALTDDVIYEDTTGATGVQNITLTERLDKYDALYFEFYFPSETTYINANPTPLQRIVEAPTGASNKYFVQSYPSYGNRYILLESTDGGTSAKITTSSWNDAVYPSVYRIHGVIFGGGAGGGVGRELLYTLDAGGAWRTFTPPDETEILIVETMGGYGVIDRREVKYTKLPSRSSGDNYITILNIPNAQGQAINLATNDSKDTIYISTAAAYDMTNMYVKVYAKQGDY